MGQGQGSITVNQKKEAGGGPPATVTDANSGLHLSGTIAQLGSVATPLLANTNIDQAAFTLSASSGAAKFLELIPAVSYQIGDVSGAANGSKLSVKDVSSSIDLVAAHITDIIRPTGTKGLLVNFTANSFQLGDIDNVAGNNTFLNIDGAAGSISADLLDGTGPRLQFSIDKGGNANISNEDGFGSVHAFQLFSNVAQMRYIETGNGGSSIQVANGGTNGNIMASANNETNTDFLRMFLERDEFRLQGGVATVTAIVLDLNLTTRIYQMGDISGFGNGMSIFLDDTNEQFTVGTAGNSMTFIYIDAPSGDYGFGDVDGYGNNTNIFINDGTQQIQFIAGGGIIQIGDAAVLIHTGQAMTDGAAAQVGTLTNSPLAGNPTKWIAIDDNGTTRHIPCW